MNEADVVAKALRNELNVLPFPLNFTPVAITAS